MNKLKLNRELRRLSTSKREATELQNLASRIGGIPQRGLNSAAKARIADDLDIGKPVHILRYATAVGFAVLFVLTIGVQMSKPGSTLYALKRRGEDIRAIVQPSFKEEIRKERDNQDKDGDDNSQQSDDKNGTTSGDDDTSKSGSGEDNTQKASGSNPEDKSSSQTSGESHKSETSGTDDGSE